MNRWRSRESRCCTWRSSRSSACPRKKSSASPQQLSAILESVGKIAELDLTGIEPTSHPLDIVNAFGEDEPEPPLTLEEALANAPDPEDGSFGVPAP